MHYEDSKILVDDEAITIRQYCFPFASSKRVRLADIDPVGTFGMGELTGRVWWP